MIFPSLPHTHASAGHEVIFTTIEALTQEGRDRSLDYKLSGIHVPKGHRHAQVPTYLPTWIGLD